jgi:hypothetical protein
MSIHNCNKRKILQELGEDAAYTFKGLYKTADYLRLQYKFLLFIILLFSIIMLGFGDTLQSLVTKILSVIALLASIWLLVNQKEYEKIEDYMRLANKYKNLFDEIRNAYYSNNFENIETFQQEINNLREQSYSYPIGKIARWWSKHVIRKEINLEWIYEKCNEK